MGKNKKKKQIEKYLGSEFGYLNRESKKAKKAAKKKSEEKQLRVRGSLDKKEIKENYKIIGAPIEIPDKFVKNRHKCNHSYGTITPAEFRKMTPAYGAFSPYLDTLCAQYGEENVLVCAACFDALVMQRAIKVSGQEAINILYATANNYLSAVKLKKDEVKDVNKLKDGLSDWARVIRAHTEAMESYSDSGLSDADLAELSRNN